MHDFEPSELELHKKAMTFAKANKNKKLLLKKGSIASHQRKTLFLFLWQGHQEQGKQRHQKA